MWGWRRQHFAVDRRDTTGATPHGGNELPTEAKQRAGDLIDVEGSHFGANSAEMQRQGENDQE